VSIERGTKLCGHEETLNPNSFQPSFLERPGERASARLGGMSGGAGSARALHARPTHRRYRSQKPAGRGVLGGRAAMPGAGKRLHSFNGDHGGVARSGRCVTSLTAWRRGWCGPKF
jgi:hypothetical protein